MAYTSFDSRSSSRRQASPVGRASMAIPRRSASSYTSGVMGSAPSAPVPTMSRVPPQGNVLADRQGRVPELVAQRLRGAFPPSADRSQLKGALGPPMQSLPAGRPRPPSDRATTVGCAIPHGRGGTSECLEPPPLRSSAAAARRSHGRDAEPRLPPDVRSQQHRYAGGQVRPVRGERPRRQLTVGGQQGAGRLVCSAPETRRADRGPGLAASVTNPPCTPLGCRHHCPAWVPLAGAKPVKRVALVRKVCYPSSWSVAGETSG